MSDVYDSVYCTVGPTYLFTTFGHGRLLELFQMEKYLMGGNLKLRVQWLMKVLKTKIELLKYKYYNKFYVF